MLEFLRGTKQRTIRSDLEGFMGVRQETVFQDGIARELAYESPRRFP
jgi:hypothetical protein